MPDHLHLPEPRHVPSRRVTGASSDRPHSSRSAHGARLKEDLDSVDDLAQEAGEIDTEFIIKLSGDTRLSPPYRKWNLTPLGEGAGWSYYVLASSEARAFLKRLFTDYSQSDQSGHEWRHAQSWETFVRDLTGIEFYGPQDRSHPSLDALTFEPHELLDVSIWPSESSPEAERRVQIIRRLVEERAGISQGVRVVAFDSRPSTTMVRIRADRGLLDRLLRTSVIEIIKLPPTPRIDRSQLFTDLEVTQTAPYGAHVGVIDDGVVTSNKYLNGVVVDSRSFPAGYTFNPPSNHGTAVCGLAAYGDFEASLIKNKALPTPFPLVHARVLEPYAADRTRFAPVALHHQTMAAAIRWLVEEHDVRVVVASITDEHAFDGPLVDEWTQTVDELARELNVVIVLPTGNTSRPFGAELACGCHVMNDYPSYLEHPEFRLASPSIASLAVTVGSIASDGAPGDADQQIAIASPGGPSPFTRVGPGPGRTKDGARKPEFVAIGGNWSYDQTMRSVNDRDPSTSVISTIPPTNGRQLGIFNGTSFAAPRVAHTIAAIATRYPDASANMLRALAAIGAVRPTGLDIELENISKLDLGVYGSVNIERSLESGGSRVVLMHEGTIPADSSMIHQIPVPPQFLRGYTSRVLRVSLAYDPPVRRQRREYIAGNMSFDVVRGHSIDDLAQRYRRQPTRAEAEATGAARYELPPGRIELEPGPATFANNTLICRTFRNTTRWDEDVLDYFVVVKHQRSPWTEAQKSSYSSQGYALAVELHDEGRAELDLYGLVRTQLQARVRIRA